MKDFHSVYMCTYMYLRVHIYYISPEEEEATDSGEGLVMMMEKTRKSSDQQPTSTAPGGGGGGGVSVFTTLGTLVLTARPYNQSTSRRWREGGVGEEEEEDGQGATLQGEIFQTVNKEVCVCVDGEV